MNMLAAHRAEWTRSQLVRDVVLLLSLLTALLIYWYGLGQFLYGLSNPRPMKLMLCSSLIISVLYELKNDSLRNDATSILATAIIFSTSPWLAYEYRDWYVDLIVQLKDVPEAIDALGQEYFHAVENPAVGIGSCFAMAHLTIRLPFNRVVRPSLDSFFIMNKGKCVCPRCGQITQ